MYFLGLSKEEVLSAQKHVVSYKESTKQNPTNMVTLFGKQVYPVKSEETTSHARRINNIDLRLPADHYTYSNSQEILASRKFYGFGGSQNAVELGPHSRIEANKMKEVYNTNWSAKRTPMIVIDLEELPTIEHEESVTIRNVDQSLVDESGLLDLNITPADELVSEPRYCFLQDLNCPYTEEETETSGLDDGTTTPLCSPKRQNVDEKDGTVSPASDTSCCTIENNSSRICSSPRALEPTCRVRLEFPVNEEEEFSERIRTAAESLVHISAAVDLISNSVARPTEPSCSCDSYELHTLGITETNTEEEFCVSSMALDELNNLARDSNKEIGLKLRRGRRMKNFQKEILPSLTSLSRHEIREDINILEAVLRSREYKKLQGKSKDVQFGGHVRNKRSSTQRGVGKRRRKNE